ncbi:hypothetical protein [uncultured Robinsoniella sp.]
MRCKNAAKWDVQMAEVILKHTLSHVVLLLPVLIL